MSSYQPLEVQSPFVVPWLEITDYDDEVQDFDDYTELATSIHLRSSKKSRGKQRGTGTSTSASDTEKDTSDMSLRSTKQPSISKPHSGSSKSEFKTKTDDWTEITDPEERRRIQNRIAQRKFREKARDQKEQEQRDLQNQANAINAYRVTEPDDLTQEEDVSGLPWGSFSMGYIVARGRESASQQGSRRASDQQRTQGMPHYTNLYSDGYGQVASFDGRDSSVGDAVVYEESPYFYDYENASPGDGFGTN